VNQMISMNLEYTKNDLPETVRAAMVASLNQQLADALDLGLQAKQAHWNVKGPHFILLHQLFDEVAAAVVEFSDEIAERAVQLGGIAEGTVQVIDRDSRLPAYALDLYRGSDHVRALTEAMARFAATVRSAISAASDAGDADTADVYTQVSRTADTLLWKVGAHIREAWEQPAPLSSAKRN
jgi:starvation-inducible DNA-binding protein